MMTQKSALSIVSTVEEITSKFVTFVGTTTIKTGQIKHVIKPTLLNLNMLLNMQLNMQHPRLYLRAMDERDESRYPSPASLAAEPGGHQYRCHCQT